MRTSERRAFERVANYVSEVDDCLNRQGIAHAGAVEAARQTLDIPWNNGGLIVDESRLRIVRELEKCVVVERLRAWIFRGRDRPAWGCRTHIAWLRRGCIHSMLSVASSAGLLVPATHSHGQRAIEVLAFERGSPVLT